MRMAEREIEGGRDAVRVVPRGGSLMRYELKCRVLVHFNCRTCNFGSKPGGRGARNKEDKDAARVKWTRVEVGASLDVS